MNLESMISDIKNKLLKKREKIVKHNIFVFIKAPSSWRAKAGLSFGGEMLPVSKFITQ